MDEAYENGPAENWLDEEHVSGLKCQVYGDDMVLCGGTEEEIQRQMAKIKEELLQMNPEKVTFQQPGLIQFLGQMINNTGAKEVNKK